MGSCITIIGIGGTMLRVGHGSTYCAGEAVESDVAAGISWGRIGYTR